MTEEEVIRPFNDKFQFPRKPNYEPPISGGEVAELADLICPTKIHVEYPVNDLEPSLEIAGGLSVVMRSGLAEHGEAQCSRALAWLVSAYSHLLKG